MSEPTPPNEPLKKPEDLHQELIKIYFLTPKEMVGEPFLSKLSQSTENEEIKEDDEEELDDLFANTFIDMGRHHRSEITVVAEMKLRNLLKSAQITESSKNAIIKLYKGTFIVGRGDQRFVNKEWRDALGIHDDNELRALRDIRDIYGPDATEAYPISLKEEVLTQGIFSNDPVIRSEIEEGIYYINEEEYIVQLRIINSPTRQDLPEHAKSRDEEEAKKMAEELSQMREEFKKLYGRELNSRSASENRVTIEQKNTIEEYHSEEAIAVRQTERILAANSVEAKLTKIRKKIHEGIYISPQDLELIESQTNNKNGNIKELAEEIKPLAILINKNLDGIPFTKDELKYLYRINTHVSGYGFMDASDPQRIMDRLKEQREVNQDILTIFELEPTEVAHNLSEINEHTKAYLGPLEAGIFELFKKYNIQRIFTELSPEGEIHIKQITIGGKTAEQLKQELDRNGIKDVTHDDESITKLSFDFSTQSQPEIQDTIRLTVDQLGLRRPTTEQIIKRAKELGLELGPVELGPHTVIESESEIASGNFPFMSENAGIIFLQEPNETEVFFGFGVDDDNPWYQYESISQSEDNPYETKWNGNYEFVFVIPKKQ